MFRGLVFSSVVHGAILAALMINWPQGKTPCEKIIEQLQDEEPGISLLEIVIRHPECASTITIPVDIVDISAVTNVAAVVKPRETVEQQPEEQVLEEAPEEEAEPDLEEQLEEDADETAPQDSESEEEVVVPDAEEETPKDSSDAEKQEPEDEEPLIKKEAPAEEEQDPFAFLDDFEKTLQTKAEERRKAPPKAEETSQKPVLRDEVKRPRRGAGEQTGNTASLQAMMRRQISFCWRGVSDLPEPERLVVVVSLKLDEEGNIIGSARTVRPARRPIGDRAMGVAMDRALVAVRKCAPYRMPIERYDDWQEIEVQIGPTKQ